MAKSVNGWSVISSSQLNRNPFPSTKIVPIPGTRKGDVATILHYVGTQFNKKVEKLYNPGCWGYAYKRLGSYWSNHASGTAIDLNAPSHPWKKKGTFNSRQKQEIRKILNFLEGAVTWGGDWVPAYVDEMHFEIKGSSVKIKRIANKVAKNPMVDNTTIFRHIFLTVMARVATKADVAAFLRSKQKPHVYIQKKFLYPIWVKRSVYNKGIKTLNDRLTKLKTDTDKKIKELNDKYEDCMGSNLEKIDIIKGYHTTLKTVWDKLGLDVGADKDAVSEALQGLVNNQKPPKKKDPYQPMDYNFDWAEKLLSIAWKWLKRKLPVNK